MSNTPAGIYSAQRAQNLTVARSNSLRNSEFFRLFNTIECWTIVQLHNRSPPGNER